LNSFIPRRESKFSLPVAQTNDETKWLIHRTMPPIGAPQLSCWFAAALS
jgi:hypothetical protein